jgi:membrane protein YqaA with SNARE-associated domain
MYKKNKKGNRNAALFSFTCSVYNGHIMVTGKSSRKKQYIIIGLMVTTTCATVVGSVFLIKNWEYVSRFEPHSYLGLFLISLLSGAPIPILTPVILITFTLGGILNPALVGVVAGLGNAVGNILTYWAGRGGLRFFSTLGNISQVGDPASSRIGRFFQKIKGSRLLRFANRQGMLAVFLLSIFPNPLLTPMVLSLGAARFNFMKFLLACWAGQTVQAMILAYLGHFGLHSLGIFGGI